MVTFKAILTKAEKRIENMQARANQCNCGNTTTAMQASQMLSQIFGNMAYAMTYDYSTSTTTTKKSSSDDSEEVEVLGDGGVAKVENELTLEEKRSAVKELLNGSNIENSKHFDELANKYGLYKKVHPEWSDDEITTRLRMYRDALLSHDKQLIYHECLQRVTQEYMNANNITEKDGLTLDQWTEIGQICATELQRQGMYSIDIDNCIKTEIEAKAKAGKANDLTPEYIYSIQRRGQGYVELYDTDGNGKISKEEFKELEKKDNGGSLDETQSLNTEILFDLINSDDSADGIDANEMASYLFGMSRVYDYTEDQNGNYTTKQNTADAIDFGEWFDVQTKEEKLVRALEIGSGILDFLNKTKQ